MYIRSCHLVCVLLWSVVWAGQELDFEEFNRIEGVWSLRGWGRRLHNTTQDHRPLSDPGGGSGTALITPPSHHPLRADSEGRITTTHHLTTPSSSLSQFLTESSSSFLIFKNTSKPSSSIDLLQESNLGVNTSINLNTSESLKVSQLDVRGRAPHSPSLSSSLFSSEALPSEAAQFGPLLPSPAVPVEAPSATRLPSFPLAASESSSSSKLPSSPLAASESSSSSKLPSSSLPHPATASPHAEFGTHRVMTPHLLHGRTKRHLQHTRQQAGGDEHHHDIILGLTIGEEDVLLDLQLNRQLLPRGYFEKQRFRNGSHAIRRPDAQSAGLCHYQGRIRDRPGSWAALSTCHGISGVVFDGKESHYVERVPSSAPTVTSPHYVMQHRHLLPRNMSCGYSGRPHPALDLFKDENFTRLLRYKRSSPNSLDEGSTGPGGPLRGPYNSNPLSRYVELVLVADHLEYKNQGEDLVKIHRRFKDIANIANALYQPLNIFIALVGVEVWQEEDQVVISQDGDQTLTNFLNYRKVRLIPEHPNDNAQLLTGQVFDSGVVGKALKGPICTYQYSGGVNMDHSASVGLVATTVAHEMGHNFGMEHDTEDECQCPDSRCIMAPSSGSRSPSHWSSCSHEYLALSFERSMDYCLRNKPTSLFDSPVCGNSFVEPGEQCDCGLPQHCTNPCCDPNTCMLYTNATCATGHCCDLQTCRPKTAGTECRPAHRECDLPEYCLGDSEYCPDDVFKEDGHECLAGKAYCHNGMCRTHEQQCQLLWGPTGQNSHDKCYSLNTQGNNNGNCGYNWANDTYYKCSTVNRKCGMMHCRHFNERLEFGMESVSKVAHRFIQGDQHEIIPCRVAQVDLGLDMVDPGLAPDGAKCGYQRMCVNQMCMAVASLRKESCDCNGNGACNNKGHCHCTLGFAPPDCSYPGLGGSIDSGPAANPNATNKFVVGLFVFFLGVVPLVVAALCLVYNVRGNLGLLGIWLTKKGLPGTTRLPTSDSGGGRTGGGTTSLCGIEAGNGLARGLHSPPSPPSSRGSKSNSPLLNGAATLISSPIPVAGANGVAPGGATFFGKHEGFTISPINTCNKGPVSNGVVPGVHANSSNGSANTLVLNSINAKKNSSVPPQPMRQAPVAPPGAAAGGKMTISGPSLKNTTNRSVLPSSTHASSLSPGVPKTLPPPPPSSAPFACHAVPPVAIVNSLRRPIVSHGHHPRPLSVPDHNSVLVGRVAPSPPASATVSPSNSASSKSSSTVSRLTSFLTKKEKSGEVTSDDDHDSSRSNTLPRKASKINRESLMQLEISAPMQLQATKLPDNLVPVRPAPVPPSEPNLKPSEVKLTQSYDDKGKLNGVAKPSIAEVGSKSSKVTWAPSVDIKNKGSSSGNADLQRIGSLREQPVTMRPPIPKFGSMRAPRPKSLPPPRPSEPPPRPPLPTIPSPGSDEFYDACVEDIDAPMASNEDPSSPTESIYATIEEETPPEQSIVGVVLPPLDDALPEESEHEPFYANSDAAEMQQQEQKPLKKSVFSFLYAKTKRKKKDEDSVAEEPLYCNIAEAAEDDGGGEAESSGVPRSPSRSSSLSPADRTSCGSSEDGGLLSEIVSELVTREPEFKNALSKKKKPNFISRKDSQDKSKSPSAIQDASPSSNGPHAETHRDVPSLSVVETEGPSIQLSKITSYPWKSNPSSSPSLPSSVSSGNESQKLLSHKPRGVFAYLKRNVSDDNQVTKIEDTGAAPETASADIKCPIRAVSNTTITTQIVTDPSSGPSSGTNKPVILPKEEPSKSLQSSLAAVRAASLQLNNSSQLFSPSNTQQLPSSKTSVPLYTNVPNPNNKNSYTEQSDIAARRSSDTTVAPVLPMKLNSRKATFDTERVESDINPSKGLLTTNKLVDAGASTPNTSRVITSSSRAGVAPLRSISDDKTGGVATSVNSASNKIGTDKGSRPAFPPDKVLLPPDKTSVPDSKPARKEPSSNVGTSISRGGPRNSGGKSKALTNKTKATSPGSSTSLASKSSEGSVKSVASTKPGRVLSPTRSAVGSSSRPQSSLDKSRSATSPPSKQQDKTSASFRTKSPTPPTNTNGGDSSKEVKKSSSLGSSGAGGAAAARSSGRRAPATANAPRTGTTAFAGKAVGSSNVASLQQRFEKEATDGNTGAMADNTRSSTTGRSVSRRTSDTKPSVTTKPRV